MGAREAARRRAHHGKTAAASPMAVTAATMLSELSFTALSTSATNASLDGKRSKPRVLLISLRTAEMEGAEVTGGTWPKCYKNTLMEGLDAVRAPAGPSELRCCCGGSRCT